ncbi:hypothetical protein D8666_14550 [Ochrobactrum soli]|uniref:hypothetical protein n=1 Tax=Ochrobactrum soli TaxID=2448455 RepID=UPI000EF1D04A|nr:hypothetical protein [[Ochrobactrum] soli]RLL73828.1 hypothetical protein D8666_14550 [[Ochrobactrum] soli]
MARPKLGESETERLHIKITKDELEAIDDWRYANRVPSRSEAVRRLIQIGNTLEQVIPTATDHTEWLVQEARQLFDYALLKSENATEETKAIFDYFVGYSENILRRSEAIYLMLVRESNRIVPLLDENRMSEALQKAGSNEDKISKIIDAYSSDAEIYSDATAIRHIRSKMSPEEREEHEKMTPEKRMAYWTLKIAEYRKSLPAYIDDEEIGE